MKEITEQQKQEWEKWLSERPDNVRKVAEQIVPWKEYRYKTPADTTGNRYIPVSYEEHDDNSVTITCAKINREFPLLGGYGVFGINPDDLIESD